MSQRQAPRLLRTLALRSPEVFDPWDTHGPLSEDLWRDIPGDQGLGCEDVRSGKLIGWKRSVQ